MTSPADKFTEKSTVVAENLDHRARIRDAMKKYEGTRGDGVQRFNDWEAARDSASRIKGNVIGRLNHYLEQFVDRIEARGARVHWAEDSAEARRHVLDILGRAGARRVIKSKVMTGEEISINHALEKAGYEVVESDLGEFIVQLRREDPYHFVFPAMHLSRGEIGDLFTKELNTPHSSEPEELTMVARRELRKRFMEADAGICGANFAVAETGMISITENEGNARLTCAMPRIQIALVGIEKVIPRLEDLALFLPMLATSGTGQALTCYNSLYGGPRLQDEVDGPEEFHIVLLDNRRTAVLADEEQRDSLHCIRCGACLNVCPIYRNIGGHSYGATYQGPIGSVLTPYFKGLRAWSHLAHASSLCGACTEICPVKIDLHHHLLQTRRNAVSVQPARKARWPYACFAFMMNRPRIYGFAVRVMRRLQHWPVVSGRKLLRPWTKSRELPEIAPRSFRDWWKERG